MTVMTEVQQDAVKIQVNDLTFYYGKTRALHGISMRST